MTLPKVLYKKLELVFESIEDIDEFADKLEQLKSSKATSTTPTPIVKEYQPQTVNKVETNGTGETSHQPATPTTQTGTMSDFLKSLNEQTMKIINALAVAPDGLSDSELREKIGIESKLVFAGVMSSVAKSAIKFGIGFENVVSKTITDNRNGKKKYHYSLTEDVKKEIAANSPQTIG